MSQSVTITHDQHEYIVPTVKVKPYKPGLLHRLGLCFKARKGYNCRGNKGECK